MIIDITGTVITLYFCACGSTTGSTSVGLAKSPATGAKHDTRAAPFGGSGPPHHAVSGASVIDVSC
jgi:hypothetical protein